MVNQVKKKESFGTVSINHFSPHLAEMPKGLNVILSFEEALKLHLGLGQILGHLNSYNRATKEGKNSAVNLCIFTDQKRITINEAKLKSEQE